MTSTGEALVYALKARGVDTIFGIPGVHTVDLYRGLAASGIRHVTPRHEQGAGFMADGYARVSGRPGVALVITGPGLTNTLTAMAQARADSVPMLVLSGVNRRDTLGKGFGYLHELPDQHTLAKSVALLSEHVGAAEDLDAAITRVFDRLATGRPGPVHIQIPLDVAAQNCPVELSEPTATAPLATAADVDQTASLLGAAKRPVILAGGGVKHAADKLRDLATRLDAPVVQTVNGRGLLHDHPLGVPASPSLVAVRKLIEDADVVLALGTELGPTDYDMYDTGNMPKMQTMIRVDICQDQLDRHTADLAICADVGSFLLGLNNTLAGQVPGRAGAERAGATRRAALEEIGPIYKAQVDILDAVRRCCPNSLFVGDSTQPIYAGNLYYDHDRPGGWFNAATGYGALGYGIPAAIGAAIAAPGTRVVCITGDGGAQFSLPEVMAAVDEQLPITFVVWNNAGYGEIATSMESVGVAVVGCDPTPPSFVATAQSFGIPFQQCTATPETVTQALESVLDATGPTMIEITAPTLAVSKE